MVIPVTFLIFLSTFCTFQAVLASDIQFKINGEPYSSLSYEELFNMSSDGRVQIKPVQVLEPHEKRYRSFMAVGFEDFLEAAFRIGGKGMEGGVRGFGYDAIVFECEDGYAPVIPIRSFRENLAYLAFTSADSTPFIVDNKLQHETVGLGPFYLVWADKSGRATSEVQPGMWPYKIKSINLISSVEAAYPNLFQEVEVRPGDRDKTEKGKEYFKKYCISCHNIDGDGSQKSTNLAGVKKRYSRQQLSEIISDPRGSLNADSKMPALDTDLDPNYRSEVIKDYLVPFLYQLDVANNPSAER